MSKWTYFAIVSSIQGLFHKIQALHLKIQGVFKYKIIFKEFSRTSQFFKEFSRPVRTMEFLMSILISLVSQPAANFFTTSEVYYPWSFSGMKSLPGRFTETSSGWLDDVVFAGTMALQPKLRFVGSWWISSSFCPLKVSHVTTACLPACLPQT